MIRVERVIRQVPWETSAGATACSAPAFGEAVFRLNFAFRRSISIDSRGQSRSEARLAVFLFSVVVARITEPLPKRGSINSRETAEKPVHQLNGLWNSVRLILEKVWPNGPTIDLDAVENVILQFHDLDLNSFAFRYPVDRKDNATLSGLKYVGPRNLRDVMRRTAGLLEASSSAISTYLDEMRGCDPY